MCLLTFLLFISICIISKCHQQLPCFILVFTGVSQGEASLVNARQGDSAELSCNVSPDSKERTTPDLFPLHVVEWVRLGFTVPILIKFGVYTPRVHPNYKGKSVSDVFAQMFVSCITSREVHLLNLFNSIFAIWLHTD